MTKKYLSILLFIYLILLFVLPWKGFYLLNDSYVYEWNVRNFFTTFQLHPLTSPTVLLQTFLGSLLYLINKDPSLLRLLSSGFYILGVVYFYKTLLYFKLKAIPAFLYSLILMFNPLYMYLGFSFMSDIYFLSTFIVSHYYFLLFIKNKNFLNLFLSTLFVIFSLLSRQTGIFLALTYIPLYFFFTKKDHRKTNHVLVLLTPILIFGLYQFFYNLPVAYSQQSITLTFSKLAHYTFYFEILVRGLKTLFYLGFMLFPISFYYFIINYKKISFKDYKFLALILIFFTSISAYFWIVNNGLMFYLPNILSYAGFNPQNLGYGTKQTIFVGIPVRISAFFTLLSVISASISFFVLGKNFKQIKDVSSPLYPYIISSLVIFFLSLIFRDYYDRYLLTLIPLLIIFLSLIIKINKPKIFLFLIIPLIVFSFLWEQDYLSFNKKVWQISTIEDLKGNKVKSTFEYNLYNNLDDISLETNPEVLFDKNSWSNLNYDILISYSELDGYCIIDKSSYFSFLFNRAKGNIYLLQKCEND